jgi:hypothetical protein
VTPEQVDRYLGRTLETIAGGVPIRVLVGAIDPRLGLVTLHVISGGYSSAGQQVPASYFLEALNAGVLLEAA